MIALLAAVALSRATAQSPRFIVDIEIAPSDQWMAVSAATNDIWIYDLKGNLIRTLHHKAGAHLTDIEISPDGKTIACANLNYNGDYCPVWSTNSWKEIAKVGNWITKSFCDPPNSIEYTSGGKSILGQGLYSHELCVWDTKTGALQYMYRRTRNGFYGFAINANTSLVVLFEANTKLLRFWDFLNPSKLKLWGDTIRGIPVWTVRQMKFSHDDKRLFIVTGLGQVDNEFNILTPHAGQTTVTVQDAVRNFQVRDTAWAGDDTRIWVCGSKGQIVCFDPQRGFLVKHWTASHDPFHAIAATHHGHTVVGGAANTVTIWDGDTAKLLHSFSIPGAVASHS